MQTVEERAEKYARENCVGDCALCNDVCRMVSDKRAFVDGAKSERAELTRWCDVETMPSQKGVLIKLSSGDFCVGIKDLRGKIWGLPPYLRNPKPVGWREIHE